MRLIRNLFLLIIVGVGLGYGAYYFGPTEAAENHAIDLPEEEQEKGVIAQLKKILPSNVAAKIFKEDTEQSPSEEKSEPITTKTEAVKVIVSRVGLSELQQIELKARNGEMTEAEIRQFAEENFTAEEIAALEAIILEEFN